jgi:hypothetical protein
MRKRAPRTAQIRISAGFRGKRARERSNRRDEAAAKADEFETVLGPVA